MKDQSDVIRWVFFPPPPAPGYRLEDELELDKN